jgi:hypothetical protein
MALTELRSLVAAPQHPVEVGDGLQWGLVEDAFGILFPEDYREYAMLYGSGKFRDESIEIVVFNPCAKAYVERVRSLCAYLQDIKNSCNDRVPYELFPNLPGLLPWGWDANGNDLFWLANKSASAWPLVVRGEGYEFQRFDLAMTSFLARAMKRQIDCILWKQQGFFPDPQRIVFVPEELGLD